MKIQIIIGSVREGRLSKPVADWALEQLKGRDDFEIELVDLKEWDLPMFSEAKSPAAGDYSNPVQKKWAEKIGEADGYIFVSPEYNHSFSAALKNALDYLYNEWGRKPATFVSFGGVSGARSIEQLRLVLVELRMAPLRDAVHIKDVWGKVKDGAFQADEGDLKQLTAAVDHLSWWSKTLKAGREA